jgi:predicted RNA-binding protein YlqC (UPF0109 family)
VKELVEMLTKKLVLHPEDVSVRVIESEDRQSYELSVNPEDMGRVIGRSGRTINALRTLVSAAATKADVYVTLDVIE